MSQSKSDEVLRVIRKLMGAETNEQSPTAVHEQGEGCPESDQPNRDTTPANAEHGHLQAIRKSGQRLRGNQSIAARLVYDPVARCFRAGNASDPEPTPLKITWSDMHVD